MSAGPISVERGLGVLWVEEGDEGSWDCRRSLDPSGGGPSILVSVPMLSCEESILVAASIVCSGATYTSR